MATRELLHRTAVSDQALQEARKLKAEKNPQVDVDRPKHIRPFPKNLYGAVTFNNNSDTDVLITFSDRAIFGCTDQLVKAGDSVTLDVQVEDCIGTYLVGPADPVFGLSSSTVSTRISRCGIDPKDIIVP